MSLINKVVLVLFDSSLSESEALGLIWEKIKKYVPN